MSGDSGAWVIQDGKLCGHIIAGRQGLRWAYMVLMQDIFDDIKRRLSITNVCVLTASMAKTLRRQSESQGTRLLTNLSSHDEQVTSGASLAIGGAITSTANQSPAQGGREGKNVNIRTVPR